MIHKIFLSREKRDELYKQLKAQGRRVYRRTEHGALLHPMYIEDYPRKLSEEEKGFGNCLYKTYFPRLYVVEEIPVYNF